MSWIWRCRCGRTSTKRFEEPGLARRAWLGHRRDHCRVQEHTNIFEVTIPVRRVPRPQEHAIREPVRWLDEQGNVWAMDLDIAADWQQDR